MTTNTKSGRKKKSPIWHIRNFNCKGEPINFDSESIKNKIDVVRFLKNKKNVCMSIKIICALKKSEIREN